MAETMGSVHDSPVRRMRLAITLALLFKFVGCIVVREMARDALGRGLISRSASWIWRRTAYWSSWAAHNRSLRAISASIPAFRISLIATGYRLCHCELACLPLAHVFKTQDRRVAGKPSRYRMTSKVLSMENQPSWKLVA
jgi:hypothetical protein